MIEHVDTFHLLAEIAIAIAGFAGVASVFGGRERQYREAELLRIRGLFEVSALVLLGSFGISVVQASGMFHQSGEPQGPSQAPVRPTNTVMTSKRLRFVSASLPESRFRMLLNRSTSIPSCCLVGVKKCARARSWPKEQM